MANRSFWDRYSIDMHELAELYKNLGSYEAVAEHLGCSKTTVAKYLKDADLSDVNPVKIRWYLRSGQESMKDDIEAAILNKREWIDVYGDRIEREEINMIFVVPPDTVKPIVNLKAILHDGTVTTLVYAPNVTRG